jgi:hypothetical protein
MLRLSRSRRKSYVDGCIITIDGKSHLVENKLKSMFQSICSFEDIKWYILRRTYIYDRGTNSSPKDMSTMA